MCTRNRHWSDIDVGGFTPQATNYIISVGICIRNDWFKLTTMVFLRHSYESAIAPVLRLVILLAITVCGLQNVNVNSVNYPQLSISGCGHSPRFATKSEKPTFGKVEQRFSKCGEVLPRSTKTTVASVSQRAVDGTGWKMMLSLIEKVVRRNMDHDLLCIRNDWFTLPTMVFLRHSY